MHKVKISKTQNNNSVLRAAKILKAFTLNNPKMSLTEISRKTSYSKSTVFRIINTLEKEGFVTKDKNNKYKLSVNVCEFGTIALNGYNVNSNVLSLLERISNITGEACGLSFLREDKPELISIHLKASKANIPYFIDVGMKGYLHASATGKATLAFQDEKYIEAFLDNNILGKFTENTMVDKNQIIDELKIIKERGYAVDNMECKEDLRCVGVPLIDKEGHVEAAISISGSVDSIKVERVPFIAEQLLDMAKTISDLIYS